ncbi:MAG: CAF17-like 4Fe-4S cluster assembly/insertion protein YgfZ [Candidatus Kariarchaeaceae archaeon]|jgi:folate-binding protein YgfZ
MQSFDYVHLKNWTIIRVSGPDLMSYLNGIVTLDLELLHEDEIGRCAFLNPRGKIRSLFWIEKKTTGITIYSPDEMRENLIFDLLKYKHNVDVKLDDISKEIPSLYLIKSETKVAWGFNIDDKIFSFASLEKPPQGKGIEYTDFKNWLIFHGGVPPEHLLGENPYEVGVNDAISLEKGCFLGQEPVSRMFHRGKPRKYIYQLIIPDISKVTTITSDNQEVGTVITQVFKGKTTYAIAFIKSNINVSENEIYTDRTKVNRITRIGSYPLFNR